MSVFNCLQKRQNAQNDGFLVQFWYSFPPKNAAESPPPPAIAKSNRISQKNRLMLDYGGTPAAFTLLLS
jgi:hypothetical protein